jgi:hypothetical protein
MVCIPGAIEVPAHSLKDHEEAYRHATGAKADTLKALAQQLDIHAENFVRTVRTFYAAVPAKLSAVQHESRGARWPSGVIPREAELTR